MVVRVSWLRCCQEWRRAVFWAGYCSSCTLRIFFPSWKLSWSVILMTQLWWLLYHPQGSLVRDFGRISEWSDLCDMKLTKTKTMIVSRSLTMHHQSPPLTAGGTVLKESDDLVILGVTFDSKRTFEKHLRSVSRAASQRLGVSRKSWLVFRDRSLLGRLSGFSPARFGVLFCSVVLGCRYTP